MDMSYFVGARYIAKGGHFVRTIERINGDDIFWCDQVGSGRCSRESFNRWAGELSPDSPPPPQVQKPAKRITQDIMAAVHKELCAVRDFRKEIAEIKISTADSERQTVIALSVWQIDSTLEWLEKELERGSTKTLQKITRVDSLASTLEFLISPLVEVLASVPEASSKAAVTLLLQALADGSELLVRLRSVIAPCLIH